MLFESVTSHYRINFRMWGHMLCALCFVLFCSFSFLPGLCLMLFISAHWLPHSLVDAGWRKTHTSARQEKKRILYERKQVTPCPAKRASLFGTTFSTASSSPAEPSPHNCSVGGGLSTQYVVYRMTVYLFRLFLSFYFSRPVNHNETKEEEEENTPLLSKESRRGIIEKRRQKLDRRW